MARASTLLTTIVSQDPIYIYFDVSENNYIKYKRLAERGAGSGAADLGATGRGRPARRARLSRTRRKLDFLDNRLDQGTGTLRARAVMATMPGRFFSPGMFARVRVTGTAPYCGRPAPRRGHRHRPDQQVRLRRRRGRHRGDAATDQARARCSMDMRVVREGISAEEWVDHQGPAARSARA